MATIFLLGFQASESLSSYFCMLWLMTWRDKIVSETKAVSTRAKCNRLCLSWPYRKPHVSDIGDIKQEDCSVLIFFGAP